MCHLCQQWNKWSCIKKSTIGMHRRIWCPKQSKMCIVLLYSALIRIYVNACIYFWLPWSIHMRNSVIYPTVITHVTTTRMKKEGGTLPGVRKYPSGSLGITIAPSCPGAPTVLTSNTINLVCKFTLSKWNPAWLMCLECFCSVIVRFVHVVVHCCGWFRR